jgi:hypothetical protein
MSPFEVLYGRRFNTHISWSNPIDKEVVLVGPYLIREILEKMSKMKQNVKVSQDR